MKNRSKKMNGVVKGAPRGFVISLLVHAAAFLLAGLLVVFSVVKKEEITFIPPPSVERPKMKLKKPKVKVKKTAKPASPTRIIAKINKADMPDLQLPEMGGAGSGFGGIGDLGGFDLMPDLAEISVFGSGQSIGSDLEGTFFDMKRDRSGRLIPYGIESSTDAIKRFVKSGFKPSKFARFYRSPRKLFATTVQIPPMLSCMGPLAFDEADTVGCLFMVHYTGTLVHQEGITFRFWGSSGDCLVVGVDGEVVLDAHWRPQVNWYSDWKQNDPDHRKHMLGIQEAAVGDWITLEPGVPHDLDILVAEIPGGGFSAQLVVEEQDVEYERNSRGVPILPIFKTAELSLDLMDAIYIELVEDEVCLTKGPVFNDYETGVRNSPVEKGSLPVEPEPESNDEGIRIWTATNGETFEAQYVTRMSGKAVLKDTRGKIKKVPLSLLSAEDNLFIELNEPPKLNISFSKQSKSRPPIDPGPFLEWTPPTLIDYVFTAKINQHSAGDYNHELQVEFFAIGSEVDGDNYILLDRQSSAFTPSNENKRSHAFSGVPVLCYDYVDWYSQKRGSKYGGYLITVSDVRGRIIAHEASGKWLFDHLENLKNLPVGVHFDKSCTRVFPPRPKGYY
jgi:hypothetical protein